MRIASKNVSIIIKLCKINRNREIFIDERK